MRVQAPTPGAVVVFAETDRVGGSRAADDAYMARCGEVVSTFYFDGESFAVVGVSDGPVTVRLRDVTVVGECTTWTCECGCS